MNNKKQYISPELNVVVMKTIGMLASSPATGTTIQSGNADGGYETLGRQGGGLWNDDDDE